MKKAYITLDDKKTEVDLTSVTTIKDPKATIDEKVDALVNILTTVMKAEGEAMVNEFIDDIKDDILIED